MPKDVGNQVIFEAVIGDRASATNNALVPLDLVHHGQGPSIQQPTQEVLLSEVSYERLSQKIRGVKTTDNSVILSGFVNVGEQTIKIEQDLVDIATDGHSIAVTGVVNQLDLVALAMAMRGNQCVGSGSGESSEWSEE